MTHHDYLIRIQALVRASYAGRSFVWRKVWADALSSAGVSRTGDVDNEDLTFQELFLVHFWVVEKIQIQLEHTSTWLARFNQAKAEQEEIVTDGQPFKATQETEPHLATRSESQTRWPATSLVPGSLEKW